MTETGKKMTGIAAEARHQTDCIHCQGKMLPGKALRETLAGMADFPGGEVVTVSPGGAGVLVDCLKCTQCGWSVTA